MKKVAVLWMVLGLAGTAYAESKAKTQACKAAKDCKGILPDICESCGDGRMRCAHFACDGGRCVTEICPPAPAPAPSGQCKVAGDCKGALPQICMDCGGKQQCAHFACDGGKCQVEICAPECKTAKDCKGALPQLCEVCADGSEKCARHACVSGKCETHICP